MQAGQWHWLCWWQNLLGTWFWGYLTGPKVIGTSTIYSTLSTCLRGDVVRWKCERCCWRDVCHEGYMCRLNSTWAVEFKASFFHGGYLDETYFCHQQPRIYDRDSNNFAYFAEIAYFSDGSTILAADPTIAKEVQGKAERKVEYRSTLCHHSTLIQRPRSSLFMTQEI